MERAYLVAVERKDRGANRRWNTQSSVEELAQLAATAGAKVVGRSVQRRERPTAAHYIGRGKVRELAARQHDLNYSTVIFDDELSPSQQRNLEEALKVKILDRTALILDIFAQHARTREGALQVELAQHEYLLPRLAGQWTHLERLEGAIGTRGPGETQLETDRRLIRNKIAHLKRELEQVRKHRALYRRRRARQGVPVVSLVGYTNAGKSTLMRALTVADVLVEDRLFATLDTCTRELRLGGGLSLALSDTIGFVRRLPHRLVASFSATLEEARGAGLLLHVIDLSSRTWRAEFETVRSVLGEIGAQDVPALPVFNKIDLVAEPAELRRALADYPGAAAVSALTGQGLEALRAELAERMLAGAEEVEVLLSPADGRAQAFISRHGRISESAAEGDALRLRARLVRGQVGRLAQMPGVRVVARGDLRQDATAK